MVKKSTRFFLFECEVTLPGAHSKNKKRVDFLKAIETKLFTARKEFGNGRKEETYFSDGSSLDGYVSNNLWIIIPPRLFSTFLQRSFFR